MLKASKVGVDKKSLEVVAAEGDGIAKMTIPRRDGKIPIESNLTHLAVKGTIDASIESTMTEEGPTTKYVDVGDAMLDSPKMPSSVSVSESSSDNLSESAPPSSSSSSSSTSHEQGQPRTHRLRVSFGEVNVRRYPIVLGDHPDCSQGPPISIGWDYTSHRPIDIEYYERRKAARSRTRSRDVDPATASIDYLMNSDSRCTEPRPRTVQELAIPAHRRTQMIRRSTDLSHKEIQEAQELVRKAQKQRQQTLNRLHLSRAEEVAQSVQRKVKRLVHKDERMQR